MPYQTYLLVVDHKANCDFGPSWPLGIEGVLTIANKVSGEIIVVIPFELLDLGSI
jgi:hypothetical protein